MPIQSTFLSQTQAAIELGVARMTVVRWIKAGKVSTVDIAGRPVITRAEVNRIKSEREKQSI